MLITGGCCVPQGVIRVIKSQNEAPLIDLSALLTPVTYLVRVYCLNVIGLQPLDGDGSCNPYLKIGLGKKTINDKANAQHGTTDPELYKCYEIGAVLPGPGELSIEMWDHNRITSDQRIARTVIDLEDRWFSKRWQVCVDPRRAALPTTSTSSLTARLCADSCSHSASRTKPQSDTLPSQSRCAR